MAAPLYGDAALDAAVADVCGERPEPSPDRLISSAAAALYHAQDFPLGFTMTAALGDAACDLVRAANRLVAFARELHRIADECEAEAEASTPDFGALFNKLVAAQGEFRALAGVQ